MSGIDDRAEPSPAKPEVVAWRGIELCREGVWQDGLYWLSLAAEAQGQGEALPALYYSYLGYGLARYRGRRQEGLRLCRRAIELEFYQPESYYFLARTHLLLDDRRSAVEAIERGLQVDTTSAELAKLKTELGERRSPVLGFLSRAHPLNRLLGKLRHRLLNRGGGSDG